MGAKGVGECIRGPLACPNVPTRPVANGIDAVGPAAWGLGRVPERNADSRHCPRQSIRVGRAAYDAPGDCYDGT
jgi:hypothetical protein